MGSVLCPRDATGCAAASEVCSSIWSGAAWSSGMAGGRRAQLSFLVLGGRSLWQLSWVQASPQELGRCSYKSMKNPSPDSGFSREDSSRPLLSPQPPAHCSTVAASMWTHHMGVCVQVPVTGGSAARTTSPHLFTVTPLPAPLLPGGRAPAPQCPLLPHLSLTGNTGVTCCKGLSGPLPRLLKGFAPQSPMAVSEPLWRMTF